MLVHLGQLPRLVQQNRVARDNLAAPDDFSVYAHLNVPERLLEVCEDAQVTLRCHRVNRSRGASCYTRDDMQPCSPDHDFRAHPIELGPGGQSINIEVGAKANRIDGYPHHLLKDSDARQVHDRNVLVRG